MCRRRCGIESALFIRCSFLFFGRYAKTEELHIIIKIIYSIKEE